MLTLPATDISSEVLALLDRTTPWDAFNQDYEVRYILGGRVRHTQTGRTGTVKSSRLHWVPALGNVVSIRWDDAPDRVRRCGTTHLLWI